MNDATKVLRIGVCSIAILTPCRALLILLAIYCVLGLELVHINLILLNVVQNEVGKRDALLLLDFSVNDSVWQLAKI